MTRLVPAVLAGAAVAVAGVRRAAVIRADAARLVRWQALLKHLALLLQEGAFTLPEAMNHAAVQHAPPDQLLLQLAAAMCEQPITPLTEHYRRYADPDAPEADVLLRLMQRLSHGSQQSRVLACQQAEEELALLAAAAVPKSKQDAKMWTSLGWTVGICVALLLV